MNNQGKYLAVALGASALTLKMAGHNVISELAKKKLFELLEPLKGFCRAAWKGSECYKIIGGDACNRRGYPENLSGKDVNNSDKVSKAALSLISTLPLDQDCVVPAQAIIKALLLLALGAKENSATQKQILELFKSDPDAINGLLDCTREGEVVKNAVAMATKVNVEQGFAYKLGQIGSKSLALNADKINEWIKSQTGLQGVVDKLEEDVVLALIAVMKAEIKWKIPFDQRSTYTSNFTSYSGKTVNVSMMRGEVIASIVSDESVKAISLPAEKGRVVIVVPDDPKKDSGVSEELLSKLKRKYMEKVNVSIPKITIDYQEHNFKTILEQMGVKTLFDTIRCQLDNINPEIYADKVTVAGSFEMNEQGCEGRGAVVVTCKTRGMGPQIPTFKADRPFTAVIYDEKDTVVMITRFTGDKK